MKNLTLNPNKLQKTATLDRILVVDDVYDNCFLLQIILENEGYTVDVANNGLTALTKIETNPPDLILLDVMMPGMSGYEVAQRIKQNDCFSSIPIVLVTAHESSDISQDLIAKTDGLVHKPIEHQRLLSQIRDVLNS